MDLSFEWDPAKAAENLRKHGVSFPEAQTVFADPLSLDIADPNHSVDEERFLVIGRSYRHRLLVVVYTAWDDRIRIISARRATTREKASYEEGI